MIVSFNWFSCGFTFAGAIHAAARGEPGYVLILMTCAAVNVALAFTALKQQSK